MNEKIITLGPKFSYSYNLVKKYYPQKDIVLVDTIGDVFAKINKTTRGIVPVENMLNGSVRETFLALQNENFRIFKAFDFDIRHILAGRSKTFSKVMSHPQALSQCSKLLQKFRQEGIEIQKTTSSSSAMQEAVKDKQIVAIGSEEAAKYYKLQILKKKISNQNRNITRFIEIGKGKVQTKGHKTSLLLKPNSDHSGLLFEILAVFKIKELNLTKIESLPTGKNMNNYIFYLDIDSSLENSRMQEAIEFLKTFVQVSVLGSYNIK